MNVENPESKAPALVLYTMEEAAAQLLVSRRWLQEFIKQHPHYRIAGRKKVFSAADIRRLHDALPSPPTPRILKRGPQTHSVGGAQSRLMEALEVARLRRGGKRGRASKG